ncbi:MAG: 2-oxoglutarate dehydrogenase complex dihydrolipoyllysine-residue succinyltransferase [Desulfobacteraceae bacterium]|nr:2-oxoglutarate dehydrogenase complex dihydrolipoyllysine-residue succinyltransferase [Desulfobacteraceae bacterium]
MAIDIVVPSVGESVTEAVLTEWFKKDGDAVEKDEPLFVIETDKVTLEVVAEADGILKIIVPENETVAIGKVVGTIEPVEKGVQKRPSKPVAEAVPPAPEAVAAAPTIPEVKPEAAPVSSESSGPLAPSVRRLIAEKKLDPAQISGTGPGGRINKSDVLLYLENAPAGLPEPRDVPVCTPAESGSPEVVRKPMSPIRKRIAQRLLDAKQNTAMLTTFNDLDMSRCMTIRSGYKEAFKEKHGVSLGFMSFFVKACVEALKEFPEINAFIDGDDIVYHNYQHIGVAIGSARGLVVPVIRHAETLGFAGIEKAIVEYVMKIKENRLELADLEGGTFTVTNGGVYGNLLSTPILNPPQSAILGMHRIDKRPVVVDDEIVIRPMMYVALSYDHRIVDGREAVTFLKRIKAYVENPERLVLEV